MQKRDFHLAPPDSLSVELFDRGRDVNGNPTAHYLILWSNGLTGAAYAGGRYRTARRVQVGYCDKASAGAIGIAQDLFPGTCWTLAAGPIEGRGGDTATLTLARDHDRESVPVIFRHFEGQVVAIFPTLPGTGPDDVLTYAHVGQHGAGNKSWYQSTRAANEMESAPLRRELESAPFNYHLAPVKRWTRKHDEIRRAVYWAQREAAKAQQEGGAA